MNPSALTLSQAVASLRLGCQNLSRLDSVADQLASTVAAAGDLSGWNLTDNAARCLGHLTRGRVIGEAETLQSLALLTARIGEKESAVVREAEALSQGREIGPLEAVRELMASRESWASAPGQGFWARMKDPTDGFDPFVTAQGTQVAFFPSPASLGVWASVVQGHWENGVGLVTFLNEKSGACGMIFVHGIGRAGWSRPHRNLWHSSGGSMAFPQSRLSFADALTRVIDKGVAMTLQWRSVDESLKRLGCKNATGLGGSKGILLHGKNGQGLAKGLEVYGEVLAILGITLTGGDEGIDAQSADILAKQAPYNIVGTSIAHYRGYASIGHTADGVRSALKEAHERLLKGRTSPVLLLGYGGIGSLLHERLSETRALPLSGIVDVDRSRLVGIRQKYSGLPLYHDRSVMPPTGLDGLSIRWNKIRSVDGLASIVRIAHESVILSPNGGPHPITFDVAASLLQGGIRVVVGSANNQAGVDASGSSDAIAWILQAGGIFHAADFVVNKMGAAAVISNAIVLGFSQLQGMARAVAANVEEEIEYAYRRGIPPFLYERDRAARAWNERLAAGEAKGGRFREEPR